MGGVAPVLSLERKRKDEEENELNEISFFISFHSRPAVFSEYTYLIKIKKPYYWENIT